MNSRELSDRVGDWVFDHFPLILVGLVVGALTLGVLAALFVDSNPCEEGYRYDLGVPTYINGVLNASCKPSWEDER